MIKLLSKSNLAADLVRDLKAGNLRGNENCRLRVIAFLDVSTTGDPVVPAEGALHGWTEPRKIGIKPAGLFNNKINFINDPITIHINAGMSLDLAAVRLAHEWYHAKQYCGCDPNAFSKDGMLKFESEAYTFEAEVAISLGITSDFLKGEPGGKQSVNKRP